MKKLKKRLKAEVSHGLTSINQFRRIIGASEVPGCNVRFIRVPKCIQDK